MANEIQLDIGTPGINGLVARTLTGTTLGSPIALTEVSGSDGIYVGSMMGAAGEYVLKAYDSTGQLIAGSDRSYRWNGTAFEDQDSSAVISILTEIKGTGWDAELDTLAARNNPLDATATQAAAAAALNAYDPPTKAELDSAVAGIWVALTSSFTTPGSIGEFLVSYIPGISTLLTRLSSARAGHLDKLNVSGTLANSDAANTYKADVSTLATTSQLNARTLPSASYATSATLADVLEDTGTTIPNLITSGGNVAIDIRLTQFISLMRQDAAYLRLVSEAEAISGLADELALIRTQLWKSSTMRTAWNTTVSNVGITTPSVGEIAIWNGYLTTSSFNSIQFVVAGQVNG